MHSLTAAAYLAYAMQMSERAFSDACPRPCPPSDATPASGVVYRRCKRNPPTEKDLQSPPEKGTLNHHKDPCNQCALSVVTEEDDIEHQFRILPKLGDFVLKACLNDEHGLMKHAPSDGFKSHHNVWLYKDVDRNKLFSVHRMVRK